MTTTILIGIIVILLIALAVIGFAWRLAVHDANKADDVILYLAGEVIDGTHTLSVDAVCALQDEAEFIRNWRGEVQGND